MGMSPKAMNMAKAGRAMKSATPDMMGRAMAKPPGMKKGGGVKKMAMGGLGGDRQLSGANRMQTGVAMSGGRSFGPGGMKKGGMAKSGGSYRKAADGIASKGKTKGKMVRMNYGGKC